MKKTQLKALLWVLAVCSASAQGPLKLIGSSQPIVATQGDDVILPCHVEPPVEEEQLIVEWSRPYLVPDLGGMYRYVHRYRDNQDEEDLKMKMYAGRTMLFREELKRCNVSLKIMDLKLSDGGWYRCFLPLLKSRSRATDIRLLVETRMSSQKATSQPTTAMLREETEAGDDEGWKMGVGVVGGLVLAAGLVYVCWRSRHSAGGDEGGTEARREDAQDEGETKELKPKEKMFRTKERQRN